MQQDRSNNAVVEFDRNIFVITCIRSIRSGFIFLSIIIDITTIYSYS